MLNLPYTFLFTIRTVRTSLGYLLYRYKSRIDCQYIWLWISVLRFSWYHTLLYIFSPPSFMTTQRLSIIHPSKFERLQFPSAQREKESRFEINSQSPKKGRREMSAQKRSSHCVAPKKERKKRSPILLQHCIVSPSFLFSFPGGCFISGRMEGVFGPDVAVFTVP